MKVVALLVCLIVVGCVTTPREASKREETTVAVYMVANQLCFEAEHFTPEFYSEGVFLIDKLLSTWNYDPKFVRSAYSDIYKKSSMSVNDCHKFSAKIYELRHKYADYLDAVKEQRRKNEKSSVGNQLNDLMICNILGSVTICQ